MNIFSFNTQVSRSRPWAVKFCHSNELFKRVTDFPSITLKIVFVTSGGSPTIRIGILIHCACRGKCLAGGGAVQETGNGNIASWLHPGVQGPLPQRARFKQLVSIVSQSLVPRSKVKWSIMRLISIHQIPQLSSLWAAVTPHTSQIILLLGIP
jgi:hypothetical protein